MEVAQARRQGMGAPASLLLVTVPGAAHPACRYMLVLLSSKGAPSEGKILSIYSVAATPDLSTYTAD